MAFTVPIAEARAIVAPYVEGGPLEDLIVYRRFEFSIARLDADADHILETAPDVPFSFDTDIERNRIVIGAPNDRAYGALLAMNLPETAVLERIYPGGEG